MLGGGYMGITVVGSISVDYLINLGNKFPCPGETMFAETLMIEPGGKGANQAVAISRLGGNVKMIGAVGDDEFSQDIFYNFRRNGVDTRCITIVDGVHSGSAFISIAGGENIISYVPGANEKVSADLLEAYNKKIIQSSFIVIQNEISVEANKYICDVAKEAGIPVLYDPAPFVEGAEFLLELVDYITPNENEAKKLFPGKDLEEIATLYPQKMVITLGEKGVLFHNGEKIERIPAVYVEDVVDSTGAGDTFTGALAFYLDQSYQLEEAIKFGQLASSFAVQKKGAQSGMPYLSDINKKHIILE